MAKSHQCLEIRLIQAAGKKGRKDRVMYRARLLSDSEATRNRQNRQGCRPTTSASGENGEMQKPLLYVVDLI